MASGDAPPPKVSKELEHAAEDDWKRSVRDAAKHRAVAQMENYDGFKNMVSVAHLRPWHAENLKDHSGPAPPAFAFAADGTHAGPSRNPGIITAGSLGGPDARDAFAPPENSMQFDKTWRRRCVSGAARWRYLGAMRDEDVDKVFVVDITGATLGEIAEALAEGFERVSTVSVANDDGLANKKKNHKDGDRDPPIEWRGVSESDPNAVAHSVVRLLDRVRNAGRFDLARRLISGKAKKALAKLFDALDERRAVSPEFLAAGATEDEKKQPPPSVDALREAFGVV